MSFIKDFLNTFNTQSIYDETDGQFMFFEKYPHSKSRNRPLSSAELKMRGHDEEREQSLIKMRAEIAKYNYRHNKNFHEVHRKKV